MSSAIALLSFRYRPAILKWVLTMVWENPLHGSREPLIGCNVAALSW
jgi:hypothetical protein